MSFSTLTETKKPLNSKLLVPSFPRKKAVEGVAKPSTYRVLFEDAYYARARDSLPLVEHADNLTPVHPTPSANRAPRPKRDHRHHNPCPWTAGFLRGNAATMLVPVCHVTTEATKADADCWWINDPGHVTHSHPGYSYDSTTRDAYRPWGADVVGRGASYRQKFTEAANGVVPVNPLWEKSGKTRLWTEKISYEHEYNSRHGDNYPARGRRHGALVLRRVDADEATAAEFLASHGLHRNRSEAEAKNAPVIAAAATATAAPADGTAVGERSQLPFRPPNFVAYHRQFVRPDQRCRDSVAGLMQPEFRHPWNAPRPEPFFTG